MIWENTSYVSANTLLITDEDARAYFPATCRVLALCDGSMVASHVSSITYDGTDTEIVLAASVLSEPLGQVTSGGIYSGALGNLCPHTHEDNDTGGTGVKGAPAQYEWSGTTIRFKNTDGSWGEWVDLGGPGFVPEGDWVTSTSYDPGDVVNRNNFPYLCKLSHTSDATSEPGLGVYWETYWQVIPLGSAPLQTIRVNVEGGGSPIVAGSSTWCQLPYSGTITSWTLLADTTGSIQIDIYKDTYANFPPTAADSIIDTGTKPLISNDIKATDTDLSDWVIVEFDAGDILKFYVDSCDLITKCVLELVVTL